MPVSVSVSVPVLIRAHQFSSVLIGAHWCSLMLIGAHQGSSGLISARQCSSVLIGAYRCSSVLITLDPGRRVPAERVIHECRRAQSLHRGSTVG